MILYVITIPLPPLSKQHKIVCLLDEAKELYALNKRFGNSMKQLFSSIFLEHFGDPVVNKRRWDKKTCKRFLSVLQTGWSPVCEKRQPELGEWGGIET